MWMGELEVGCGWGELDGVGGEWVGGVEGVDGEGVRWCRG